MIRYQASHKNDVWVNLTPEEITQAIDIGKEMYRRSQERQDTERKCANVSGVRIQILGSLAERVAAKALGIEWTGWIDTFKRPDLHHNIEVRSLGENWYGLRVYERDNSSRRVVAVIIEKGRERGPYRMPGWINAAHAKKDKWINDPGARGKPVYLVPQRDLHPLSTLLNLIHNEQNNARIPQ